MKNHAPLAAILIVVVVIVLLGAGTYAEHDRNGPSGFLATLKSGQRINLKEHSTVYEIQTFDQSSIGQDTITEVGVDYVVVRDVAGITETRIPVYAIRSIVHIRTKTDRRRAANDCWA